MKKVFRIQNLCCANCAAKMERGIQRIDGVQEASISFMAQKLTLECVEERYPQILEAVKAVIQKVEPDCKLIG